MAINIEQYQQVETKPQKEKTNVPKAKGESILTKEIHLFGNGVGAKMKASFYSDLNMLLLAGLDIQKALELIESNQKKKPQKEFIQKIGQRIIEGESLSQALNHSGKVSEYEIYSLEIGEETGRLNDVLGELSGFYEKTLKYRRQLFGALSYPLFVVGFAFLVVFFMLKYLVPLFSDIYNRFGGDLPMLTQKIIFLSDWLGANSIYLFLGFIGIIGFFYLQKGKLWFRKSSAFVLLRMPIFGSIIKNVYLSRFCQSMYFLLNSKVPLLRAVQLVQKMIRIYPIENSLEQTKEDVLQGKLLYESLGAFAFYPKQVIAMLQVGEEAGNLDLIFKKLADQYSEEVEQKTAVLGSLIEPVLIVGLGAIVGVILIAMYLPLFQMSSGI